MTNCNRFLFYTVNKSSLRKVYLQKRKELTTDLIEVYSQNILSNLKTLDIFSNAKTLHIFYPIVGKKEVNTLIIVEWFRNEYPDIKLVLPKSNLQNHTLEHITWTDDTPLALNEWGITEPEYGQAVAPKEIDIVIMPLLAVDKRGNRVGYGKGFYDRFLTECRTDTIKIGLSFFEPEEVIEGVDTFDIPLNITVTPNRIWKMNP
ncbi:5-formyltetrahydrofolate cyclo-ligase [Desertivirga arenae]|uniref:5-formyltetrahydrofolate cyclo-ligase n=1 Tax=Desertivirga arenae TaxID=2810309 RepID=UPI001A9772EA|nr:5-formyltetrahydrofolate cyclo-ligase [Pedobacter sp. SYSU D00823]